MPFTFDEPGTGDPVHSRNLLIYLGRALLAAIVRRCCTGGIRGRANAAAGNRGRRDVLAWVLWRLVLQLSNADNLIRNAARRDRAVLRRLAEHDRK